MAIEFSGLQKLFIGGKWVEGSGSLKVIDPGNGEIVADVCTVGREESDFALAAAARAWPAWRKLHGRDRGAILHRAASLLTVRAGEMAELIARENGKPIEQARGEVGMSIDHLQWFAEEARRGYGRIVPPQADGKRHLIIKQPVGVVGAISPWNFPLVLAVRKTAPALAAGCPVVLRPSGKTPLCALAFARILEEAGIPEGIFQVLVGPAEEIADVMMENPVCRKVTFTGSTAVGKELLRKSARTVTGLSLELGGHAPIIIFDDADMDAALEGVLVTKFRNSGQSCIASNRVYVQRTIYKSFIKKLAQKASELKIGYSLDGGVDIGPLISPKALDGALSQIENAVALGAELVCGGKAAGMSGGCYLEPTVLADVSGEAVCMSEETFAPVAPVVPFDTEDEVLKRANDTPYGLASYVYTRSVGRAFRMGEELEAGSVGINDAVPSTSNCPFGGFKESGVGRELGSEGMEAFLETKHLCFGGVD